MYQDKEQTIVNKDLLQLYIDSARTKVNALPESEDKAQLLAKVEQAYNSLQEILLKGPKSTKDKLVVHEKRGPYIIKKCIQ
ncbi:hypothetical protein KZR98_002858 [Enterococcus faecalis]|nr:hypothetical protein [Enterococcus faecalis]